MAVDVRYRSAYADASWTPFWLDRADRPAARPALEGDRTADLVIVGAGFTGLWPAVQALQDLPGREVVVLEGQRLAFRGSGRHGGLCHRPPARGLEHGRRRVPGALARVGRVGPARFGGAAPTPARARPPL